MGREPADVSSTDSDSSSIDSDSSDWDVNLYKALNDSVLNDTATSSPNSRVLPPWASSSVSREAGPSNRKPLPSKRGTAFDGNSPSSKDVRNSDGYIARHDKDNKVSSNNGTEFDNQLLQIDGKRMLPSSLQPSSSNSRPKFPVKDVGSSQIHEDFEKPYRPALSSHTNENFSRTNYDAGLKNYPGSRVLPPWMKAPMHIPPPNYGGQPDPSRPAVVQEKVGDERLIYQVALQHLDQPTVEAALPDGLLSVSLFRHQKIALAWMLEKENSVACSGGILADDQGLGKTICIIALILMQKLSSKTKSEDPSVSRAEALDLDDDNDKGTLVVYEDKKAENSDEPKVSTKVKSSSSTREFHNRKPLAGSLVVCPASVLRQWARELEEKVTDEARLEVLIYHGGSRTKDPAELAQYDVVLTTYSIVAKEVPTKSFGEDDDDDDKKDVDGNRFSSEFANKKRKQSHVSKKGKKHRKGSDRDRSGTLAKVHWFRVILDEAQTIKNSNTQIARSCSGLRAKKRWCLSGTPIQNSINELFSYFRFLKCEPYAKYKSFCYQLKIPISRNSSQGYMKLQAVLRAIMLRRTKDTLIDGKPIINLPPKTINLTSVDFSPEERAFYRKLEAESRARFKAYAAAGTLKQNYANILLMLLRLRQACDHPLLVKGFSSESVNRVSSKMAKNLPKDMQTNLLKTLETLNICLLCSDPPEDAVVTICGHTFCYQCVSEYLTGDDNTCPAPNCRSQIGGDVVFTKATLRNCISDDDSHQCFSKIDERSSILQDGKESVNRVSLKMAKNLPKDMQTNLLKTLETLNICLLCSDPPEDAVVTICGHTFCYQCVYEYLTGDDNTCPAPNCRSQIGGDVVFTKATLRSCISDDDNHQCFSKIGERSSVLQDNYSSSKIRATLEIIWSNCEAKTSSSANSGNTSFEGPIKTIVFSQWTKMLDLLEMSLNEHCIEYRRLDGSMSLGSRDRAVKEFNSDPEVIVMLMSLKAGNLGLNMVAASHIILLDLWWNPATEDQAIDRAHRIGQTRPVTVSRLTIKDTVEDRILALQEEKRKMVASAFGEDQGGSSVARLTKQDLKYLFMAV